MLFSRASCATLTPGCIDCATSAILKSRGKLGRRGRLRATGISQEAVATGRPDDFRVFCR